MPEKKIYITRDGFQTDRWVEVSPEEWDRADHREILFLGHGKGIAFVRKATANDFAENTS